MANLEVKSFNNDKFEMKYTVFGNGPKTFVIIPELVIRPIYLNTKSLEERYKSFEDEYTIYCIDRKENMEESYTIEEMALDALTLIHELHLKNIYLYGVSLGAMIATYMAIKEPKLIKKMVLVSTSYYMNDNAIDFMDKMINYIDQKDSRSLVSLIVRTVYSDEFVKEHKEKMINHYADLSDYELRQIKNQLVNTSNFYLLNDLNKITAKTLIIASKGDKIFPIDLSLRMVLALNCDCVIYDDYGHGLNHEADDFIDRLKNYLDK